MIGFLQHHNPARAFTVCGLVLVVAWLLGLAVAWFAVWIGVAPRGELPPVDWMFASLIGGGVGVMAVVPGVVSEWCQPQSSPVERSISNILVASSIRLVGTVAVVVIYGYQMPAEKVQIAALILVWYVYLTSVDVVVLALVLPRLDKRHHSGN